VTVKVHIAKVSYQTPKQVLKADIEQNENLAKLQKAYAWAISIKNAYNNKVTWLKRPLKCLMSSGLCLKHFIN
jgi:hypothetical protein